MKKNILTWILLFAGAFILGIVMLVLSALVSNESVRNHVLESAQFFTMPRDMMGLRSDDHYSVQDHFTDALMAEEAMMIDRDHPFQSVMRCDFPFTGDPISDLQLQANGEGADLPVRDYARYWHGYLVWLRPMLACVGWNGIREITLAMLFLVVLIYIALWARKKGVVYAIGACLPILICYFPQTGISPQHSSVYFVGLIASIVLLSVPHICDDIRWSGGVMVLAGCGCAYVDLLTSPMVSLLLPLLTYCILTKHDNSFYKRILMMLAILFVSYFGFWMMKWVIATITTDINVIESGFNNARVRSYGCDDDFYDWTTIFERLDDFIRYAFVWAPILVAGIIWVCSLDYKKIVSNLYLLGVAVIPVVWLFILRQHSAYHFCHISWRNMIPSLIAIMLFMIETSRLSGKEGEGRR